LSESRSLSASRRHAAVFADVAGAWELTGADVTGAARELTGADRTGAEVRPEAACLAPLPSCVAPTPTAMPSTDAAATINTVEVTFTAPMLGAFGATFIIRIDQSIPLAARSASPACACRVGGMGPPGPRT